MAQYNDEGYTKKTVTEIVREKEILFEDLFDIINNSPSDILWQWMKTGIYERQEIEILNELAAEQMSISDAVGAFLDKHGIECGILRKGETKAQGYVEVTTTISGADQVLPKETQFTSATQTYESDDEATIEYQITMTKTKTGESEDYFSSDYEYVGSIVRILDENNNVISPIYYSLNTTYHNHINWLVSSSAVLIENQEYTVQISGTTTKRVEVTSISTGEETNASIGTVTTCVQYPSLTVTNREEIDGGAEQESDAAYRTRLLDARRRTFTLGSIKDLVLGMEGVRACKVYQDMGVDQTSVSDWDNPSIHSRVRISGTTPMYSQSFVPGDQICTLGRITLKGNTVNNPPAIACGIKRDISDCTTGAYFDYIYVEEYDLDHSITGWRDIEFDVNYNGLDKTKTYRFDIWCKDPVNPSFDWINNYWEITLTNELYGSTPRKELYINTAGSGATCTWTGTGNDVDMMFKTHFKGAGFTILLAMSDGYGFDNITGNIATYMDYVDEGGYSPICIQCQMLEAEEILIDVQGTIYITALADFQNVRREINESIEEYLESLNVGDSVTYSKIYQIVMNHAQVWKLEDLLIKREDETTWYDHDAGIEDNEIPDLGTRSFQKG